MNPIALRLADGSFFFAGLALALAAEVLLVWLRKTRARAVLTVLAAAGVIFVVASATPLPLWAYACWLAPALVGLVLLNRGNGAEGVAEAVSVDGGRTRGQRCPHSVAGRDARGPTVAGRSLLVAIGALIASSVGLCVAEIPYHLPPRLPAPEGTTIYVLGDSISAGLESGLRCWPAVLEDMTSYRVVNLAQDGATVEGAIAQARGIGEPPSLVIVEIGGNDLLLREADASPFRDKLETLVSSLRSAGHQVLVFELPLFPFQNAYGRAQRRVAARHGAAMLPKRCFTGVLGMEGGTVDGLHLSQKGHDALARIIAGVVEPR